MFVIDYDCITAAGPSRESLFSALHAGEVCSHSVKQNEWQGHSVLPGGLTASLKGSDRAALSRRVIFSNQFQKLWGRISDSLSNSVKTNLTQNRIGLFFASTKGMIEDFIYLEKNPSRQTDPFFQITEDFKKNICEINFSKTLSLSNACCSSHVALEYVETLFQMNQLDYAIVLAGDLVGPFVYQGFNSLKVLSHTQSLPFAKNRDGLQLGEAATVVLLAREKNAAQFQINAIASETEGSSITRPSVNGEGLFRTLENLRAQMPSMKPDFIIAHGTGTIFNDLAEDQALSQFSENLSLQKIPITNTKWSIGHTLGASGMVDLIAACEIMKSQKIFSIAPVEELDPTLKMNYFFGTRKAEGKFHQAVITSLGFGGIHASLSVEKVF